MTSEEEIGYYPFPNVNLEENIGERYQIPAELQNQDPFHWLVKELIEKRVISDENLNPTEDNLEPRYISKEVAVFGLMDKEWSHFHAIKNEPGYNYIFKVWLQLLREQVSQGKRSVRILRLESFGDEEQRATEVWNKLSQILCEELTNFCKNEKINSHYNDIFKLSDAYSEINSFNVKYESILTLICKESIRILFSQSKETKLNWRSYFRTMKKGQVEKFFDDIEDEEMKSSDFKLKQDLIDYIMDNIVTNNDESSKFSETTRSLPIPDFINKIITFTEKILKRHIHKLPNNKMFENYAYYSQLVDTFDPDSPNFGHAHGPSWKVKTLDWRIRRATEKFAVKILEILICNLKWMRIEKGSNFDILHHYAEDKAVKMIDGNNIPNMIYFTNEVFNPALIPNKVSEARKRSKAFNPALHINEPHSIFRFFDRDARHWMFCNPVKHTVNKKGGTIQKSTRNTVSRNTSKSLKNYNVKGTWGEKWNRKWPQLVENIDQDVCDALNNLQNTQWEINLDLLNFLTDGFKITHSKVPYQQGNNLINLMPFIFKRFDINEDEMSKLPKYRQREIKRYRNLKLEEIRDTLKSIFRVIRNGDNIFWQPWNICFRGRLHSNSVLSPQKGDFSKAIIRFKEWKTLGESGWKWLRIHVCNLLSDVDLEEFFNNSETGLLWKSNLQIKKKSFNSRIKWIDEHLESIIYLSENIHNPIILDKLGVNLEELIKPKGEVFQRLAAILEFERVVMEYREKGDWNQVKSGLPIHFDASCNGFQHVSALLQDSDLARKVNLLKPEDGRGGVEDLYGEVAEYAKSVFEKGENSNLREYLQKNKHILGVDEEDVFEFREIFTRSLAKRPTIAKGYGQNKVQVVADGITSWKDNSSPPRIKYHDNDWAHYLSNSKSKECRICKKWNNKKRLRKNVKKRVYKFETLDELREHNNKNHKVPVWHIESPLYKNLKSEKIRAKIDSREWCSVIQMEIATHTAQDLKDAIDYVTNDSFGTLGGDKLKPLMKEFFLTYNRDDLVAICKQNEIELKGNETIPTLQKRILKKDILIENNLLSWSVPGSDGLKITYFKENKTDLQSINATNDKVEDLEYLLEAARLVHPSANYQSLEEVLDRYEDIDQTQKTWKSSLGKILLYHLIEDDQSSSYNPKEVGKLKSNIFDIAYTISAHRAEDTKLKSPESGITANFVHSLDAAHMRYVINSMADSGIKDFWAVHDDFGTHAADIDTMMRIIREEFVELHKGKNIDWWLRQMHEDCEYADGAGIGDFDLDLVLESEYFVN